MNEDFVKRLAGEDRRLVLSEIAERVENEKLTPKLRQEARLVARYCLSDSNASERDTAAELLGAVGNRGDWFALKTVCRDPEWWVRCAAYSSLAEIGGKQQFRFLSGLAVEEKHPVARRWAYVAAYDADPERAVLWLEERWVVETEEAAEVGIVSCLAREGREEAVARLRALAESEDHWVYHCARDSLAELE